MEVWHWGMLVEVYLIGLSWGGCLRVTEAFASLASLLLVAVCGLSL